MVVDGILYAIAYIDGDSYLVALDAVTGNRLWRSDTITSRDSITPVLSQGVFYMWGAAGFDTWNGTGHIKAVDAVTGEQIWLYEVDFDNSKYDSNYVHIIYSPTVADRILYVSPDAERLSAIDTNTGELLWQTPLIEGRILYSPAVASGVVVFSANVNEKPYLYGFDAVTGDFKWRRERFGRYVPRFLISQYDVIYVWPFAALDPATGESIPSFHGFDFDASNARPDAKPTFNNCIAYGMKAERYSSNNYASAADVSSGETLWSFSTNESSQFGVTYSLGDDGIVYILQDNHVFALNSSTGNTLWSYEFLASPLGTLAYFDEVLYVPTNRGLYALDTSTQELLWRTTEVSAIAAPKVANGIVYLTSREIAAIKGESLP